MLEKKAKFYMPYLTVITQSCPPAKNEQTTHQGKDISHLLSCSSLSTCKLVAPERVIIKMAVVFSFYRYLESTTTQQPTIKGKE